jgi:3-methylcrotonyl-CoA carboxylase alpha subunit
VVGIGIRRLLIANRGEIAVRIIRACRELGVESVAVYSDADARASHVNMADRAVSIGAAAAEDSYLSIPKLVAAAQSTAADAIHPGYGFLSENAAFAAACEQAGLIFVGPPALVIAQMGSKIDARRLMQQAGVPIVPGETPGEQTDEAIRAAVERVGLPALVKATAGGGGKGMRLIRERSEIAEAVQEARREALAAFGNGTLYVERLVERARHVEVQVFGDNHGRVVHVFERECSVQRRHQKVIEESPSPAISRALGARITEAAVRAARAVSYRSAGTIEFLVDPSRDAFYFLEMNTRLQVEHPVTELVAGVDLVRAQLLVASGEALPWSQETLGQRGHAIEARVYAEDPSSGFLPQAGRLLLYREPRLPGVRVDGGVAEGDEISVHYDPLLAKVIAWDETRDLATARLIAALRAYPVLGIRTNIPYLLRVLEHPRFRAGTVDTGFLDREGETLLEEGGVEAPEFVRAAVAAHAHLLRAATTTPQAPSSWDPWNAQWPARSATRWPDQVTPK